MTGTGDLDPAARFFTGPGEPLVYVTFHVDAQGKLSITAQEDGTGRDLPVLRR